MSPNSLDEKPVFGLVAAEPEQILNICGHQDIYLIFAVQELLAPFSALTDINQSTNKIAPTLHFHVKQCKKIGTQSYQHMRIR